MFGIQLYIKTETIKRPLVQTDLRSTLISLYNSFCFLSRKNVIKLWPIIYNNFWEEYQYFIFDHSTNPKGLHQCLLWNDSVHLCYVVKCAESLLGHYTYNILTCSFNFPFPPTRDAFSDQRSGLLVINTIHLSNTVVFPSTTFFAETTVSSKIATWKAMRLNDVALNYWTSRQTQRIKPLISLILRGRVHTLH